MKQISFMHGDIRYFTFFGYELAENAMKAKKTNVVPLTELITNQAYTKRFPEYNDGVGPYQTPIATSDKLIEDGACFIGNGTFEVDGITYNYKLTKTELAITEEGAHTMLESVEEAAAEVEEQEETAGVVEEAQEEIATTVQEKVNEELKSAPEELENDQTEDTNGETLTEEIIANVPELTTTGEVPVVEAQPIQVLNENVIVPPKKETMSALDPRRECGTTGCVFGGRRQDATLLSILAGETYAPGGCIFGGEFHSRKDERAKRQNANARQRRTETNVVIQGNKSPVKVVTVPPANTGNSIPKIPTPVPTQMRELAGPSGKQQSAASTVTEHIEREQPVKTVQSEQQKPLFTPANASNKKAVVRAKLAPDVAAIIGDVPLDLLMSIPEYTNSAVDVNAVKAGGDTYCTSNAWHRCGKWFAVDEVPTVSRFICNNSRGLYFRLPMAICKEWVSAVKES